MRSSSNGAGISSGKRSSMYRICKYISHRWQRHPCAVRMCSNSNDAAQEGCAVAVMALKFKWIAFDSVQVIRNIFQVQRNSPY
ncbi:hypothetical protein ANTQUA_LOCUS9192 [Anthophora quadrimaculata]